MRNTPAGRLARDERGFTLIELMIVVMIIAILIAVAVPAFLGARSRAQARAAQANLRQALVTVKAEYAGDSAWPLVGANLAASEPSLVWKPVDVVGADAVNVVHIFRSESTFGDICTELHNIGDDGHMYAILDVVQTSGGVACPVPSPGTWYSIDGGAWTSRW